MLELNFLSNFWFAISRSKKEVITSPFVQRAIFLNAVDFTLTIIINFVSFNKVCKSELLIPLFNKITLTPKDFIFFCISSILKGSSILFSSVKFIGSFNLYSLRSKSSNNILGDSCFSPIFFEHTFFVIAKPSITFDLVKSL